MCIIKIAFLNVCVLKIFPLIKNALVDNYFQIITKIFNRMLIIINIMRHNYKSHGRHCYLRSFKTNCKKCGREVLYWECTHGSKLFFNYPPYGKLIRHNCRGIDYKNRKKSYNVIVKTPSKNLINPSPSCPVCGKLFKFEDDILIHLKELKKNDEIHRNFFESKKKYQDEELEKKNVFNVPKFGRITIKERNSDKS